MTKRKKSTTFVKVVEMELFGLVKTHEEINPGHGRHKTVQIAATALKLEAII